MKQTIVGESIDTIRNTISGGTHDTNMYCHPCFLNFFESQEEDEPLEENLEYWAEKEGLDTSVINLDEYVDYETYDLCADDYRQYAHSDFESITANGWLVLCVFHTEDGASAVIARPII